MYKIVEVKSITVLLAVILLAVLILSAIIIGVLWGQNRKLLSENDELLKASTQLTSLLDRANKANNSIMNHVATIGMNGMAIVSHACGPKPVKDTTKMMEVISEFHGKFVDPLTGVPNEMSVSPYVEEEFTPSGPVAGVTPK